ncbi:MAG TPA: hypothetical protein VH482_18305 [Thermomicrobiales bacterium]|jgi:hypothetical protein
MLSPRTLAGLYDLHLAAVWRGHESSDIFGDRLGARWSGGGPSEADATPDAIGVLGGAGAGIRWFAVGENIVGFVAGRPHGCSVVARTEIPPQPPSAAHDWVTTPPLSSEAVG